MPSENEERPSAPEGPSLDPAPRALAPRLILLGGVVSALVASALLLAIAGAGRIAAERGANGSTPSPVATATPSPSPTPQTGFLVYSDKANGFVVQYPQNWSVDSTAAPVIQFSDDSNETGYVMQVALPATSALPDTNSDPASATTWVNYELNIFAQKYPQNFILLDSGSQTREIDGVIWQSGAGLITNNSSGIHLQVYATVYHGKPYLINLLCAQERYNAGTLEYFDPMLNSFAFLNAAP
ncbi:MAG TPA: hypothetical protein VFQ25_15940 [Ktedonobacterales bacterium]|nr:hypothetical protein [Ktedonobacterales bacterium]